MKYTLFLITCYLLAIAPIFAQSQEGFLIKGHIEGIEDGTVVRLYDITDSRYLDSAYAENGDFTLKGRVDYPRACWLQCQDEYAILEVENTKFVFESPLENMFLNYSAKGGREQELRKQLAKQKRPYDVIYHSYPIKDMVDSLVNKRYRNEEEKQNLEERYHKASEVAEKAHKIYIAFGKKHPNSYLGLNIIYMNRQRISRDSLISLYQELTPKLKKSPNGQGLQTFLFDQKAQKGKPFLDFQAQTLMGDYFKLSSLKGNYIYLTFWSRGCGPCRMENRLLRENLEELPEGLSLVSFSTDVNREVWKQASEKDRITWYNVSDLSGNNGITKTRYGVQAIPHSFLINQEGIIVEEFRAFHEDIIDRLNEIVQQGK